MSGRVLLPESTASTVLGLAADCGNGYVMLSIDLCYRVSGHKGRVTPRGHGRMSEQSPTDGAPQVNGAVPPTGLPGLRAAREAKLLTQQELADAAGVSRLTISELESGARNAYLRTIRRLATALEVPAPELLQTAKPARRPPRPRQARVETATQRGNE